MATKAYSKHTIGLVILTTSAFGVSNVLLARFMHVGKPFFSIAAIRGISIASALLFALITLEAFDNSYKPKHKDTYPKKDNKPHIFELCITGLSLGYIAGTAIEDVSRNGPSSALIMAMSSLFAAVFFATSVFMLYNQINVITSQHNDKDRTPTELDCTETENYTQLRK